MEAMILCGTPWHPPLGSVVPDEASWFPPVGAATAAAMTPNAPRDSPETGVQGGRDDSEDGVDFTGSISELQHAGRGDSKDEVDSTGFIQKWQHAEF